MAASTVKAVPKLYDVILWLMGCVEKFPRSQKFTLGDRIVNIALDTLDTLIEATYTPDRLPLLRRANVQLEKLRFLIRLCHSTHPLDSRASSLYRRDMSIAFPFSRRSDSKPKKVR